jgi:hypothetical protein
MKAKGTVTKSWRDPMREQTSQRKRGANQPFCLQLSNGKRVSVSDPMAIGITPRSVFIVRRTGTLERIALDEVAALLEVQK